MKKLAWIEVLRGVAAIGVVLHHFLLITYPAHFTGDTEQSVFSDGVLWDILYFQSPFGWVTNGNFWVCLFFVISGFVLSLGYFRRPSFYALIQSASGRYLRLYIPVAALTLVVFGLLKTDTLSVIRLKAYTHSFWLDILWREESNWTHLIEHLSYKIMFNGADAYNTVFWTISFELIGSFMVYATLLFIQWKKKPLLWILLGSIASYLLSPLYSCFYAGILIAYLHQSSHLFFPFFKRSIWGMTWLVVGLYFGGAPSNHYFIGTAYE